jgi:hypothetical protein
MVVKCPLALQDMGYDEGTVVKTVGRAYQEFNDQLRRYLTG